MNKRKALSQKLRFEVFKRDGFICVYCGAHPPQAILHVDHVIAVAAGGLDDIDNLVTACIECNQGKGARDLKAVPRSMEAKAEEIRERELQILGYQEIMQSRRDRIEDEMWCIAEVIQPGSPEKGMRRDWTGGIRRFIEKIGFDEVLDAAETARNKYPYGGRRTFLYFCGICWKKIRGAPDEPL